MLRAAPAVEGHTTGWKQRLMGSVVPALRFVGSVVLAHPDWRLRFSISLGRKLWLDEVTEARKESAAMVFGGDAATVESPRQRHRRDCGPHALSGLLFVQQAFIKHLLGAGLYARTRAQQGIAKPVPCPS